MHKKFGEVQRHSFQLMRADRQTHRQTYSLQYFTTLRGEVINQLHQTWVLASV